MSDREELDPRESRQQRAAPSRYPISTFTSFGYYRLQRADSDRSYKLRPIPEDKRLEDKTKDAVYVGVDRKADIVINLKKKHLDTSEGFKFVYRIGRDLVYFRVSKTYFRMYVLNTKKQRLERRLKRSGAQDALQQQGAEESTLTVLMARRASERDAWAFVQDVEGGTAQRELQAGLDGIHVHQIGRQHFCDLRGKVSILVHVASNEIRITIRPTIKHRAVPGSVTRRFAKDIQKPLQQFEDDPHFEAGQRAPAPAESTE